VCFKKLGVCIFPYLLTLGYICTAGRLIAQCSVSLGIS